jgi:predicted DNA-binding transcriptional regulator AlpA
MATADHSRRARQQELRGLLAELVTSGKKWHVINEGLAGRGAGRLVLRPGADGAAPRRTTGQRLPAADGHVASWYFRHTDSAGKRPWMYIGVCDPTRKAGLDLDDALFEARKLSEELRGPAGGDLIRHRAQEQRRKEEALAEQRRLEAQEGKTLRLLLDTYVDWLKAKGKQRSAYDTENLLRKHLFLRWPELCAKPAAQVTRDELAHVVNAVDATGKERTAGKVRTFIAAAYQAALTVGKNAKVPASFKGFGIQYNPARDIDYKGAGIHARERTLATRELGRLLVLLRRDKSIAAQALRILMDLAGQRQQQLWRTRSSDVDCDEHTGKLAQWDPKGNRSKPRRHEVPLLGRTRRKVAALVATAKRNGTPLLFTTDGRVPIRDETVRALFRALAKRVCALDGNEGDVFSLSDVRRTAESELDDWGYSRESRGWLLSHGFSGVQARHYERKKADRKVRVMLRQWQAHLLRLERDARRDIRARAAAGEKRFVECLAELQGDNPTTPGTNAQPSEATPARVAALPLALAVRNESADPLLRIDDVLALLPISASTLRKLRQGGEFPPPSLHLGRTPVWRRSEVDRFLERAMANEHAHRPPSPRHLQLVGR